MSAAEFAFWETYYLKYGFPVDRLEAATAIAGAALVRSWGGTAVPADLIPRFGAGKLSNKVLAARLAALPGAKVKRVPRPERKAGAARPAGAETENPRPRLLNPKR